MLSTAGAVYVTALATNVGAGTVIVSEVVTADPDDDVAKGAV